MWQQGYLLAVCERVLLLKTQLSLQMLISLPNKAWRCQRINMGSVWMEEDLKQKKHCDNPGLNSVQVELIA